jgi:hypothetical protein
LIVALDFYLQHSLSIPGMISNEIIELSALLKRLREHVGGRGDESFLGAKISVFGNIADAMTVCELTENETITSHNIEALLLVKTGGEWKIAAQAWDSAPQGSELPEEFLD